MSHSENRGVPAIAVRKQLARILGSKRFTNSGRLRDFLSFVVERALEGDAYSIKESLIGVEVFQREPSYDPRVDAVVRVMAVRLRNRLKEYYDCEGRADPILIKLSAGSYVPSFRNTEAGERKRQAPTATPVNRILRVGPAAPWPSRLRVFCSLLFSLAMWPIARDREQPALARIIRFSLQPPPGVSFGEVRIDGPAIVSQDGRYVAFVGITGDGISSLWVRALDSISARRLTGSEGASDPFWAPNSAAIGYFAKGNLRTVLVSGGPSQILCGAPAPGGGSWSRDGVILYAPNTTGPLYRVAATGAVPRLQHRPPPHAGSDIIGGLLFCPMGAVFYLP